MPFCSLVYARSHCLLCAVTVLHGCHSLPTKVAALVYTHVLHMHMKKVQFNVEKCLSA